MKTIYIAFITCTLAFISLVSQTPKNEMQKKVAQPIITVLDQLDNYSPTVIPDYFILGTLSDYLGRFYKVKKKGQVDCYYKSEKPVMDYLNAYIEKEYKLKWDSVTENTRSYKTYSKELSTILNQYYENDGHLKEDIFQNHEQIGSFLLGAYYRYGEQLYDSVYKIRSTNSPKNNQYYLLLKKIGCKNILYKHLDYIPAHDILYFEASEKLTKYLDILEAERSILTKQHYAGVKEIITKEKDNKQADTFVNELIENENNMIKEAFKPDFR
jgi:hypothetical protein